MIYKDLRGCTLLMDGRFTLIYGICTDLSGFAWFDKDLRAFTYRFTRIYMKFHEFTLIYVDSQRLAKVCNRKIQRKATRIEAMDISVDFTEISVDFTRFSVNMF